MKGVKELVTRARTELEGLGGKEDEVENEAIGKARQKRSWTEARHQE